MTLNNGVGGLSADGRTLVLGQADVLHPNGDLVKSSSFAVLSTKPMRLRQTVTIQGDFGFDALSPHGRTVYLIQRSSAENLSQYRVRAYDLVEKRLLSRVVADKRQRDWLMEGYPVARAASPGGRWVYTLYSNPNNYPFVHALDTVSRTAVCVGIPLNWTTAETTIDSSTLSVKGNELVAQQRLRPRSHHVQGDQDLARKDAAHLEAPVAAGLDGAARGCDDVLDDREPEPGAA